MRMILFGTCLAVSIGCGTALAAMNVYTLDGLSRVRPHDRPSAERSVNVKAARNEFEPFQVVVRADAQALRGVNLSAGDFHGPGGQIISRNQITFYREHYVEVTTPSPKSKEGAGMYPDALIPFVNPLDGQPLNTARFKGAPFDVEPEANQPVWVDVFVSKDTAPGVYTNTVTVTADAQRPVEIPISLTVWNFTLPDTPSMRANFGGFGERIAAAHKVERNSKEMRVLEERYAGALAAHRICPLIPGYLYPKVNADGSVDPTDTHAALKEWMERFHITGFPISFQGREPLGKERERNAKYLKSIFSYLKDNGWEKFAYIYVLDEPNDATAYEEVRQRAKLIHESEPGIKVLCTEQPTPQEAAWGTLVESVDIWVPLWTLFEEKSAAERLAAGEALWSYTALCQGDKGRDTPYWQIDFPLLDYRIPAWESWRYGITGLLYWTTVYWQKAGDVWTNPVTYGEGRYAYNGEGSLFYPGAAAGFAGPVASLRLKQIREGLEDYEYFKLLEQRGDKSWGVQLAARLAESWVKWDEDPQHLYALREEIAKRLNATKP
jgi:hypothetical protein